jgi:dihydropteroate synthase
MRILTIEKSKDLENIMRGLDVDYYGAKIMSPKAQAFLILINALTCAAASIIKQEMLSLGGDAALPRGVLTGKLKKTDCLIMGSLSQLQGLKEKLKTQPFGLKSLSRDLSQCLSNYQKNNFVLKVSKYTLNLSKRAHIMGIVNATADSFSGDGLYRYAVGGLNPCDALDFVSAMINDGADIIDVGGQSSRPQARPVSLKQESSRVIPLIKFLAKKIKVPISIDTYSPEIARAALDNGAVIINDINGLRDSRMRKVASRYKAAVVIMHMQGKPLRMPVHPQYQSLMGEITGYFNNSINLALEAGVENDKIIIDPGIGFGKTVEHNLMIINRLKELKCLGRPILIGPSRKSFIGKVLNAQPQSRLSGTISAAVLSFKNGANILRVHDVKQVREALKLSQAILSN